MSDDLVKQTIDELSEESAAALERAMKAEARVRELEDLHQRLISEGKDLVAQRDTALSACREKERLELEALQELDESRARVRELGKHVASAEALLEQRAQDLQQHKDRLREHLTGKLMPCTAAERAVLDAMARIPAGDLAELCGQRMHLGAAGYAELARREAAKCSG
jgi:chromosome segregation ATPase